MSSIPAVYCFIPALSMVYIASQVLHTPRVPAQSSVEWSLSVVVGTYLNGEALLNKHVPDILVTQRLSSAQVSSQYKLQFPIPM